jgi:HK97 family phage major capsid protein
MDYQTKPLTLAPFPSIPAKELQRYDLCKALREAGDQRLSGLEKAVDVALSEGRQKKNPNAIWLPDSCLCFSLRDTPIGRAVMRDAVAGTPGAGGSLIQTDVSPRLIDLLRKKMVFGRAGAVFLDNLQGDLAIAGQTSASTSAWLPEISPATSSDRTFAQIVLSPKRLNSVAVVSRQLLTQSALSAQQFVANDLLRSIAVAEDYAGLWGTGPANNQPVGLFTIPSSAPGTSVYGELAPSVTFATGGPPTWAAVLQFEANVAGACDVDLDPATTRFVCSPSTLAAWKGYARQDARGATTYYPNFYANDAGIAGWDFIGTNQIGATNQVLFGDFSNAIFAHWGGTEVFVDPYSQSTSGRVRFILDSWVDVKFRHTQAWAISTNSGVSN